MWERWKNPFSDVDFNNFMVIGYPMKGGGESIFISQGKDKHLHTMVFIWKDCNPAEVGDSMPNPIPDMHSYSFVTVKKTKHPVLFESAIMKHYSYEPYFYNSTRHEPEPKRLNQPLQLLRSIDEWDDFWDTSTKGSPPPITIPRVDFDKESILIICLRSTSTEENGIRTWTVPITDFVEFDDIYKDKNFKRIDYHNQKLSFCWPVKKIERDINEPIQFNKKAKKILIYVVPRRLEEGQLVLFTPDGKTCDIYTAVRPEKPETRQLTIQKKIDDIWLYQHKLKDKKNPAPSEEIVLRSTEDALRLVNGYLKDITEWELRDNPFGKINFSTHMVLGVRVPYYRGVIGVDDKLIHTVTQLKNKIRVHLNRVEYLYEKGVYLPHSASPDPGLYRYTFVVVEKSPLDVRFESTVVQVFKLKEGISYQPAKSYRPSSMLIRSKTCWQEFFDENGRDSEKVPKLPPDLKLGFNNKNLLAFYQPISVNRENGMVCSWKFKGMEEHHGWLTFSFSKRWIQQKANDPKIFLMFFVVPHHAFAFENSTGIWVETIAEDEKNKPRTYKRVF